MLETSTKTNLQPNFIFEGELKSTICDQKVKQPPLKDIAGLFRSFHYSIYEIGYELNSRPRWALIPLKGISNIINN